MATPMRPCPYCGAAVLLNATACGTCGRPMPPLAADAPPTPQAPMKTMFGYAAPALPQPHRAARPPGGTAPPGANVSAAPPEAVAAPAPAAPQTTAGSYEPPGQVQPQGYGQPQAHSHVAAAAPTVAHPPISQQPASPGQAGATPGAAYAPQHPSPPPAGGSDHSHASAHSPPREPMALAPLAGSILGFPIQRIADAALQRKVLWVAGIALLASVVIPYHVDPTFFAWNFPDKFAPLIWPVIAGAAYLLITAAPAHLRQNIPPAVLRWLPFAVSLIGIMVGKTFGGLYTVGYATVVFGLLLRIGRPDDRIASIIIAVGSGLLAPDYFDALKFLFHFEGIGGLGVIHNLLWFVVWTAAILCFVFVVPAHKLPPALRSVEAFAPLICAALIAWLPLQVILVSLGMGAMTGGGVLALLHGLVPIVAYFGVLIMTAPAAYDELRSLVADRKPT